MTALDLKDKRILYELSLNSRQSNKEIAKKVGLSEQVTGYRIKRLQENGIIRYFYIRTNPAKLGYFHYKVFLKTKNLSEKAENEFISFLKTNKNTLWVVSTRGDFDYIVSILAKDIHEFSRIYEELQKLFGSHLLHRQVSIVEKASTFSRDYFIGKISQEFKYGGKEDLIKLDEDDINLLRLITIDARLPATEIAKRLGVSADKVIYRLKKLKDNYFLQGFGTSLDLKKLTMKQYLIALKLQDMSKEKFSKLKEFVKKNKSIQYFIYIVGDHDIELELEIQSDAQLDELFKELKKEFLYELTGYKLLEIVDEHKLSYFPF